MTIEKEYTPGQRPHPAESGGPLDMPGGDNGRPGEDQDRPYGVLKDSTDLDHEGKAKGKSPMEDPGTEGGTAGTRDDVGVMDPGHF